MLSQKLTIGKLKKKALLDDGETVAVLRKIVSELQESIEAFKRGLRPDLLAQSQKQLEIINRYLPAQMTDEDLKSEIQKIIAQNKELYQKNPKAIIGICIKSLKNRADTARIIKLLNQNGRGA